MTDSLSAVQSNSDSNVQTESTPVYKDEDGNFTDDRMRNAFYWAAQLAGWMIDGPNAGVRGRYYVEVKAGKPILVLDDSFHESCVEAITTALIDYNFPPSIEARKLQIEDGWRIFINEPTSDRLYSNYIDNWRAWESHSSFEDTERDR